MVNKPLSVIEIEISVKNATKDILNKKGSKSSFQYLYRLVYNFVIDSHGGRLYSLLKDEMTQYLNGVRENIF